MPGDVVVCGHVWGGSGHCPACRNSNPFHTLTVCHSSHPNAALSAKIYQGLLQIRMIDQQGNVLEDPRLVLGRVCVTWLGG